MQLYYLRLKDKWFGSVFVIESIKYGVGDCYGTAPSGAPIHFWMATCPKVEQVYDNEEEYLLDKARYEVLKELDKWDFIDILVL